MNDKQRKAMFAKMGKPGASNPLTRPARRINTDPAFPRGSSRQAQRAAALLAADGDLRQMDHDDLTAALAFLSNKADKTDDEVFLMYSVKAAWKETSASGERSRARDFSGMETVAQTGDFFQDTDEAKRAGYKPSGYGGARTLRAAWDMVDALRAEGKAASIFVTPERLAGDTRRRFEVMVWPARGGSA